MKTLYDITRTMLGERSRQSKSVKNKESVTITTEQEQRTRWVEHFRDILNRPPPTEMPSITATEGSLLNVNVNPPAKAEIERALKQLKNGKAAGSDDISPEVPKVDPKTTIATLHPLFSFRSGKWRSFHRNGRMGTLSSCPKKGNIGFCKNCRGIMFLSIPSKVFCHIILERLKHALDHKLRREQAGFRKHKSCTAHIASLRIAIEQSTERQTPL